MTFEELQKANEVTKPTDIGKGRDYVEVNQRIKAFRMLFPNGSIVTDLISNENGVCIFKATAIDEEGRILGTGTAYEKEGSTFINKTSYIENCETSAVGRALAMVGIGIDVSVASKEEVENAKLNQNKPEKPADSNANAVEEAKAKAKLLKYVNDAHFTAKQIESICKHYGVTAITEMNLEACKDYLKKAGVEKE